MKRLKLIATLGILASSAAAAFAGDVDTSKLPPPSPQKDVTYEKDIKPILDKSCVDCHGPKKQKSKLRLDSLQAALKGGDDKVIQPGNSARSILVLNIAHLNNDKDQWMPPKGKISPLTNEQIGLIRAWIDQGAK
jgi:mono/diheme cytochrome c family protein